MFKEGEIGFKLIEHSRKHVCELGEKGDSQKNDNVFKKNYIMQSKYFQILTDINLKHCHTIYNNGPLKLLGKFFWSLLENFH